MLPLPLPRSVQWYVYSSQYDELLYKDTLMLMKLMEQDFTFHISWNVKDVPCAMFTIGGDIAMVTRYLQLMPSK